MPDDIRPKQSLQRAISVGTSRPSDSPERQRVRMGDDPMRRQAEDYSIRTARDSNREVSRGTTVGDIADRMAEERAAGRTRRRSARGRRR